MASPQDCEDPLVLADIGSTFTKVRVIGRDGRLLRSAQSATTVSTDIFEGLDKALDDAGVDASTRVRACSSAGGGLAIGVVGLIDDLTAEAGRRAALSAGARVTRVVGDGLRSVEQASELLDAGIDMALLVGGTDGGDRETVIRSARFVAAASPRVPIIVAGNRDATGDALAALDGHHAVAASNVMPRMGRLEIESVRELVRELFISHVIGGKLPGSTERLQQLVSMATPDAVLSGVELLGDELASHGAAGGVVVVDVGGATTDVHSVATPIDRYQSEGVPQATSARTVEGDIGMRWSAPGVVTAAHELGILEDGEIERLRAEASVRASAPDMLAGDDEQREIDRRLAQLAITVALRRHAGVRRITLTEDGAVLRRDGRDLSDVRCIVGLGGVFTLLDEGDLIEAHGWACRGRDDLLLAKPESAAIDDRYMLAAVGLLRTVDDSVARRALAPLVAALTAARSVT